MSQQQTKYARAWALACDMARRSKGWPDDPAEIERYLFQLSQSRDDLNVALRRIAGKAVVGSLRRQNRQSKKEI